METLNNEVQGKRISRERIYLFDNIKFVAILLMVVGHSIGIIPETEDGNWLEKSLFVAIYSFHMPLFIFMSGLFVKPMDKSTKFPKQRVIAFTLMGIVLRICFSIVRMLVGFSPRYGLFDMYDSFVWFMWAMAMWLMIVWLFREYNTKIILLLSLLIGCMAGYDEFLGDQFSLMRTIVFLPFFIAGYMINPEDLQKLLSKTWLKVISAVVVAGFITYFILSHDAYLMLKSMFTGRNRFTCLNDYGLADYGFFIRMLCYAISTVLGFAVMCLIPNRKMGYITFTGTKTLQIYFWHRMFLTVMDACNLYSYFESTFGGTVASSLMVLIGIAITFLCTLPVFSFPTKQLLSFGKPKSVPQTSDSKL